jgi:hypothetical protein
MIQIARRDPVDQRKKFSELVGIKRAEPFLYLRAQFFENCLSILFILLKPQLCQKHVSKKLGRQAKNELWPHAFFE